MKLLNIFQNTYISVCLAAILTGMVGCGERHAAEKKEIKTQHTDIAVDASFENIMQQEIDVFEYTYRNAGRDALIIPYYISQRAAIDSLMSKSVKTIVIARELSQKEKTYLKAQKRKVRQQQIAVDAIALIVNQENPLSSISVNEIKSILKGEITRWNEIEPSKLGNIQVVFDQNGSGTAQYMRDSLLNGERFADNVFAQESNRDVFRAVTERRNALGILGVSWISSDMSGHELSREELYRQSSATADTTMLAFNSDIKVLEVYNENSERAVKPYQAYIFDGSYPLYRPIYMITTTVAGTLDNAFFAFVTGYQGQKVIQLTGVLPKVVQPRMVNLTN